jgi:hypothetical protein
VLISTGLILINKESKRECIIFLQKEARDYLKKSNKQQLLTGKKGQIAICVMCNIYGSKVTVTCITIIKQVTKQLQNE